MHNKKSIYELEFDCLSEAKATELVEKYLASEQMHLIYYVEPRLALADLSEEEISLIQSAKLVLAVQKELCEDLQGAKENYGRIVKGIELLRIISTFVKKKKEKAIIFSSSEEEYEAFVKTFHLEKERCKNVLVTQIKETDMDGFINDINMDMAPVVFSLMQHDMQMEFIQNYVDKLDAKMVVMLGDSLEYMKKSEKRIHKVLRALHIGKKHYNLSK
ncbi:MAG: hypothetical protein IJA32_10545 [Lachnospiraceae bacterium]|nr:hypothetical protein [Lachnospiraceae bacterium]